VNLLAETVQEVQGQEVALAVPGGVRLIEACSGSEPPQAGQSATLAVRAERIALAEREPPGANDLNILPCHGNDRLYRGKYLDFSVETNDRNCSPASAIETSRSWRTMDAPSC
jgi:hypothetical protein